MEFRWEMNRCRNTYWEYCQRYRAIPMMLFILRSWSITELLMRVLDSGQWLNPFLCLLVSCYVTILQPRKRRDSWGCCGWIKNGCIDSISSGNCRHREWCSGEWTVKLCSLLNGPDDWKFFSRYNNDALLHSKEVPFQHPTNKNPTSVDILRHIQRMYPWNS